MAKSKLETVRIGPKNWQECCKLITMALIHGTPSGKRMAREELERMAQVADMSVDLAKALKAGKRQMEILDEAYDPGEPARKDLRKALAMATAALAKAK